MTIDAHVHLWRLSRGDNVALSPTMAPIYRDCEPADLKPLIDAASVGRVVVVQAAETLAESLFAVGLARKFACWIRIDSLRLRLQRNYWRICLFRQMRRLSFSAAFLFY